MKICPKCNVNKKDPEFRQHPGKRGNLFWICRVCEKKYKAEYYEIHKGRLIQKNVKNRRIRYQRLRIMAKTAMKDGCVDCGLKDIRCLDFDHVHGNKSANVAQLIGATVSVKRLMDEIKKCEVRCANCHRIVTYKRRNVPVAQLD